MSRRVAISVDFRPTRSPNQPKKAPPMGRARKPTKLVVKAAMVPAMGSSSGKKSFAKIVAAKKPYKKKSYHSMAVPMVLAPRMGSIPRSVTGPLAEVVAIYPPENDHEN